MVNENIRTVVYFDTQNAEDLYRCKENGKVYIRQECDDEHVRWLSSVKWVGGYEASCPLDEGVSVKVVNRHGDELFSEIMVKKSGYMDTVAEKRGCFFHESIVSLVFEIMDEFKLHSWAQWKDRLMHYAWTCNYTGYYENWLYDAEYEKPTKIKEAECLGVPVRIVKIRTKHRVCGYEWTTYEIQHIKTKECLQICGYEFE